MKSNNRIVLGALAAAVALVIFAPPAGAGQPRPGDVSVDIYAVAGGPGGVAYFAGELTSPTRKCRVGRRINVKAGGQLYDSGLSSSRGTFGLTTDNVEDSELIVPPKKVKANGKTVRCIGFVGPLLLN